MKFPTKGSLSENSFIEILKDAAQSELTGMIRLENAPIIKVVYMQKGLISFASSNEKSDRLTEVLKRARKLTPEQVEDAQARLKPKVSIGKTLVELGYISTKDLLWGAHTQVDGILHQLLFWPEGKYQILEGALPREIIQLNLTAFSVIFEGIMKTQNREWILQHIGSPDAIYAVATDFQEQNEILKLPVNEVVSHLDGRLSLHDIAERSDLDSFEICKTVVALECLDLARTIQDVPLEDVPLEMGLSASEAEPPIEAPQLVEQEPPEQAYVEIVEESPGTPSVKEATDLGQVAQLPTVEQLQAEPAREEEPVVAPVALPEQVPEQHEMEQPEEKPVVAAPVTIPEDRRVPMQNMAQMESDGTPRNVESGFGWKTVVTILLVIIAAALAIFYYLQHKSESPAVLPSRSAASEPHLQPTPARTAQPVARNDLDTAVPAQHSDVPKNTPLELLQAGKIADAANAWNEIFSRRSNGFSIQLVIACQDQTVSDTHRLLNYSEGIVVLPISYKGQNCYRVLFGQFASRAAATAAIKSLPEIFLKQVSPASVIEFPRAR